jgi:hypothetical protein
MTTRKMFTTVNGTTILTKEEWKQLNLNREYFTEIPIRHVHTKDLRLILGLKGRSKVMLSTEENPEFKNIANFDIPFKYPMFCHPTYDGAYFLKDAWVYDYPVGNAYVINN